MSMVVGPETQHSVGCLAYFPSKPCGTHGACFISSSYDGRQPAFDDEAPSSLDSAVHFHLESYCVCEPSWVQSFELAPLSQSVQETVELHNLPCIVHLKGREFLHQVTLLIAVISLIIVTGQLLHLKFWVRQTPHKAHAWFLVTLFLCVTAETYRIGDLENRAIGVDVLFTSLYFSLWIAAKVSQYLFYSRYLAYSLNPLRNIFLPSRASRRLYIVKILRPFAITAEIGITAGVILYGVVIGSYSLLQIRIWLAAWLLSSSYNICCAVLLFMTVLNDMDIITNLDIVHTSKYKEADKKVIEQSRKEIYLQVTHICTNNTLIVIGTFLGLIFDNFLAQGIYLLPISVLIFSIKTPVQLQYDCYKLKLGKMK